MAGRYDRNHSLEGDEEIPLLSGQIEQVDVRQKEEVDAIGIDDINIWTQNWPPFYPLIHCDIANDIPVHLQRLQYVALTTFLGAIFVLTWNMIAVHTHLFVKSVRSPESVTFRDIMSAGMSVNFLVIGAPGAYVLWYGPLYDVCTNGTTFMFWDNFVQYLFYLFHIAVFVFAAIAPPVVTVKSVAGILTALDLIRSKELLAGKLYFIGFVLCILEALLSVCLLQQVYMFRGGGKEAHMEGAPAREETLAITAAV